MRSVGLEVGDPGLVMISTPVAFIKGAGPRYRTVIDRRDGVRLELDGGGYNKVGGPAVRVPHDVAHFVVEDALRLDFGLWGVIAAGGLFGHIKVVGGRQPPHAARRGQAVVDRAGDRLTQAEIVVRAVADLALEGRPHDARGFRAALGERWAPPTATSELLAAACLRLQHAGVAWAALAPGERLEHTWTLPEPPR